jgi:tight adherence protein B
MADLSLPLSAITGLSLFFLLVPHLWANTAEQHLILSQLQRDRQTWLDKLETRLMRARVGFNAVHYIAMSVTLGCLSVWLSSMILQSWLLALPAFLAGVLFTERLLSVLGAKQKERFEAENVKAFRIMASTLRTSPSYLHAFEQVACSPYIDKRVAAEYLRAVELIRAQVPLELVMREFYERTGSADVSYLATILQVQREMGGDMAKSLDLAASSILRRRQSLRRQRAAMSQILAQVNMLSVMPFVFVATLYINNPHHFDPLTATAAGRFTILGCFLCILVGGEVIRYLALKGLHKAP